MTVVKGTVNFRYKWSKWPFCKKMIRNGHVTHHSRARKLLILKKIILTKKKLVVGAARNLNQNFKNFSKFSWWRHSDVRWPNWTKIVCIWSFQSNMYQNGKKQNAYVILNPLYIMPYPTLWRISKAHQPPIGRALPLEGIYSLNNYFSNNFRYF